MVMRLILLWVAALVAIFGWPFLFFVMIALRYGPIYATIGGS